MKNLIEILIQQNNKKFNVKNTKTNKKILINGIRLYFNPNTNNFNYNIHGYHFKDLREYNITNSNESIWELTQTSNQNLEIIFIKK